MAAFSATLHVSWISNYSGNHRVCYKLLGDLVYDCTTIVACPVPGDPYTADIIVTLDNERCEDMIFEIYVQATCNAEASETGRIDASTTFVVTPTCISYLLTCVDDLGGTQCQGETHDNCTGGTTAIPTSLTGDTFIICSTAVPKVPQAGWTIVPDPAAHCCYDCVEVSFLMDRGTGPSEIGFMSCVDGLYTTAILPEAIEITACMVRDTWYFPNHDEANCTITVGTVCNPWALPLYELGLAANYVALAGSILTLTAPQFFATGDIGENTLVGVPTFGTGSDLGSVGLAAAEADVLSLYNTLKALSGITIPTPTNIGVDDYGSGAGVFVPGIYTTSSAIDMALANPSITLDGDGDYVFVSTGGAITFCAGATMNLINGAKPSRIFWVANNAITTGSTNTLKGNFMPGAAGNITIGLTNDIEGRLLTPVAITIDGTASDFYLPIT